MNFTRTYDPSTGQEILVPPTRSPRLVTHGAMASRVALQAVKARVRETNRRQNTIRWSVNRTSITDTWNPLTLYPVLFDTEHHATEALKGRKVHCNPTVSWRFQCGEPGWYNIKGNVTITISFPAVPATMIQRATCHLRHRSFKNNTITYYEQSEQFATVGLNAGVPVPHYLRGWSLPIRDKVPMEAGDTLEVYWEFQGAGAISFIDEYKGFIACQRTGEKYIDGSCCHG